MKIGARLEGLDAIGTDATTRVTGYSGRWLKQYGPLRKAVFAHAQKVQMTMR